jgi:hypothetical protein
MRFQKDPCIKREALFISIKEAMHLVPAPTFSFINFILKKLANN